MLTIDNLTTDLDSDSGLVRAVDALSLTIERGETFALVGESGCGKSMTALSILRLLPDSGRVSAGRVDVDGIDITQLPEARMRDIRGRRDQHHLPGAVDEPQPGDDRRPPDHRGDRAAHRAARRRRRSRRRSTG